MSTKLQKFKWQLYINTTRELLLWGLERGYIASYGNELILRLRNIYDGGIPASILLLCNGMSNGHCYDRALLMARALLDSEDDVRLIYASVDGLRLNPKFIDEAGSDPEFIGGFYPLYADHCIIERITSSGQHIIYDTSSGLIYDKDLYWKMEHPQIRHRTGKDAIIEFVNTEQFHHPEDIERDKYAAPLILPVIEMMYNSPAERYSEILRREVEHFKTVIDYAAICREIAADMPMTSHKCRNIV